MRLVLILVILFFPKIIMSNTKLDIEIKDYCSGYLGEVYWTLDPIEDESIRLKIENFFNNNFPKAKDLNFNFYYDKNNSQFLTDIDGIDLAKFKKTNYPNFEIIILNSYINNFLINNPHGNYCPAFGNDCNESSLDLYFRAAEDFSESWNKYEDPYDYLSNDFRNNKCFKILNDNILKEEFLLDLNLLIRVLLD